MICEIYYLVRLIGKLLIYLDVFVLVFTCMEYMYTHTGILNSVPILFKQCNFTLLQQGALRSKEAMVFYMFDLVYS